MNCVRLSRSKISSSSSSSSSPTSSASSFSFSVIFRIGCILNVHPTRREVCLAVAFFHHSLSFSFSLSSARKLVIFHFKFHTQLKWVIWWISVGDSKNTIMCYICIGLFIAFRTEYQFDRSNIYKFKDCWTVEPTDWMRSILFTIYLNSINLIRIFCVNLKFTHVLGYSMKTAYLTVALPLISKYLGLGDSRQSNYNNYPLGGIYAITMTILKWNPSEKRFNRKYACNLNVMKIKYKKEKRIHNPIGHVTATAIYMEKSGTERIRVRERKRIFHKRAMHTHTHPY